MKYPRYKASDKINPNRSCFHGNVGVKVMVNSDSKVTDILDIVPCLFRSCKQWRLMS